MRLLRPFLSFLAALSAALIALVVWVERSKPTCRPYDKTYTGTDAAAMLVMMYREHGPMRMLIEAKDGELMWPDGRVLEGVEVKSVGFYPGFTDFGGISYFASVDVGWRSDRPIRTGLSRRIFGP
jgi:hypothetical protein